MVQDKHVLMLLLTAALTAGVGAGAGAAPPEGTGADQTASNASPIFRTTGPDGRPVFTDRPGAAPAERVDLPPPNSFDPADLPITAPATGRDGPGSNENMPVYEVAIDSPGDAETIRENAGNLTVVSRVEPALASGDRLQLLMDGTPAGTSTDGVFSLTAVDRGEHHLQVRVVDERGRVHASSATHRIQLLRRSVLNR